MKIKRLSYKNFNWELENLLLSDVNLIVGKNGTGKTRTLQTIDLLGKIITQKRGINWGAEWDVLFENDNGEEVQFKFRSSADELAVTFEEILLNGSLVLSRGNYDSVEPARIKNFLSEEFEDIYPPKNKLVIQTNRDVRKYPFLEDIANWAENSYGFKFGNISTDQYRIHRIRKQEYDLLMAVEDIPSIFEKFTPSERRKVISDFNSIGYNIKDISMLDIKKLNILEIMEEGVNQPIWHTLLSQGMFRALALIIYIQYLISRKKPATIIIDDLCEGLDYERATKLGKLLFAKALEGDIQLIATSNDSFLMEVVDLKYWNVLTRNGKTVKGLNVHSNPQIFEAFKFTGLSNFDLFSFCYYGARSLNVDSRI